MYLRIVLLLSSAFNLGLILKNATKLKGLDYYEYIIVLSFMILIFSFINFVHWFKGNYNKGERR